MKTISIPSKLFAILLIPSLIIATFAIPVPRASANASTTLLQPSAMGEIRGDGSRSALNFTAHAGNDSVVTFDVFGSTYTPVLKAIYLEYTIPAALAGTTLCLAARITGVTNDPSLTIQTLDSPLTDKTWAGLAAAPGGNVAAYSSFVQGQVVFYPAGRFTAGTVAFVICPAMACPGNSTIQVPEPMGSALYGSPPVLAPAGSTLNSSQLSGLVHQVQIGNLSSLVNVGSLNVNASFLQGVFNQNVFSNFGLGGQLNNTLARLGMFTGGGKINGTLGTIGGFVNGTGLNGNSTLGGLFGNIGSSPVVIVVVIVGGIGLLAVLAAKARKNEVKKP